MNATLDFDNVCRCCLASGCHEPWSSEYYRAVTERNEIYFKMLKDTFNITMQQYVQLQKCICDLCISKLQDASIFKRLVIESEQTLTDMINYEKEKLDPEIPLKVESRDTDDDFDDKIDDHCTNDFTWDVDDDRNAEDKGQIFVIKLEPKDETEVTGPKRAEDVDNPDSCVEDIKIKTSKSKKNAARKIQRISGRPKETQDKKERKISQTQIASRENSLKLILNSNLCLFKSLKTKFGCFQCKESFMSISELREHSKDHADTKSLTFKINSLKGMSYRNVDISSLSCKLCDEKCPNLDDLRRHLTTVHNIQFGDGDHFLIPYNLADGFKCVLCELKFNTYTRLSIHMNTHYANNVCEICGGSFINRLSLRMHVNAVHREKKCSLCPTTFVSHYLRVKHMKKVHNVGQYKRYCLLCNKTFRYSYLLEEHRIKDHGVKRPLVNCSQCGKTFLSPQNLKVHVRSVHVRERNHPCEMCGMRFFTRCDQKRHERTHEDVRMFACGFCEGRFKAKDSWRRHLRRQHPHLAHTRDSQ